MTALSKYPTIPVPPDAHRDLVRDAYARCNGGDIGEAIAAIVGEAFALWRAEQERREQQSGRYTIAEGTPLETPTTGFLGDLADPAKLREFLHADSPTYKAARSWPSEPARVADGTAPGTERVVPDDGAWLVAAPVLCRVTGLEPRECACSTCSAARRKKG